MPLLLPLLLTKKIYCHWYCHWYWQDKHIGIAIAIDTDMEKTLPLLLPLILIWKKHCHCYWHWYCDMEKIAIDIAIDIVTGKILLLILSLVLLIPQPLLLLLPLEIWRPDNCYCYCSKNFAIAHVWCIASYIESQWPSGQKVLVEINGHEMYVEKAFSCIINALFTIKNH